MQTDPDTLIRNRRRAQCRKNFGDFRTLGRPPSDLVWHPDPSIAGLLVQIRPAFVVLMFMFARRRS